MDDLAAFLKQKQVREAINLFQRMANGSTLRDNGPTEPLLLDGDPRWEYPRTDVETLRDLGFLQNVFAEFKLTDKAERLVKEITNRQTEEVHLHQRDIRFWIVVVNGILFFDLGMTPPNLRALIGEEKWNPGDRIVVSCHDPDSLLISHLPLALASEVYGGLSGHQIDDIEKIATDGSAAYRDSSP